ncbi:hypothetical protein [Streptomyces corynorhini]|uniref:Uncharacterized protein n=1 Tax=Streptomyces corynorhini TaxID=2282652 RepID=A0A370B6W5_9ACTN|nr:hypothetical protein [Streptomyces corynorhini]RDG37341.1 hypothetical protein DVH02_15050 [Streptomyces corynorhini]
MPRTRWRPALTAAALLVTTGSLPASANAAPDTTDDTLSVDTSRQGPKTDDTRLPAHQDPLK